VHIY